MQLIVITVSELQVEMHFNVANFNCDVIIENLNILITMEI